MNEVEKISGTMKNAWRLLAAVCVLVIGVYAAMVQSGVLEFLTSNAADTYYNLLVQGFRDGQLSLKKDVPPGLTQLADPYDPAANTPYLSRPYRMLDLSYYKGRLYLYWGVTPAVILFWPYAALTGQYLFHRQAVVIFCTIGFLTSVGLLGALWRRYFAEASVWVVAVCTLALGLATGVPVLLSQADVYEVPISCGYMLTMLALGAIWQAVHEPERRCRWLAGASVAYGLAVGARPSLVFGAVVLLVPAAQAWRERRQFWAGLMAATGPMLLIGLGLMLYNVRRFGSPFEFGQHYQLAGARQATQQLFSLRYLWFNFRVYFLDPAHWSARFPFLCGTVVPPLPAGYTQVRDPFGVLMNIPLVWLALAVPPAWRNRPEPAASNLRWFTTALAVLFGMCALTLALFWSSSSRYEMDFLPALVLLAVMGVLGLERVLADRPARRRAMRWGWGLLVGFSMAFNLLASAGYYAETHDLLGSELFQVGKVSEAVGHYQQALHLNPDFARAHNNLAIALKQMGRLPEAMEHWEQALRLNPDYARAHYNLGMALAQTGRRPEAIEQYQQAVRCQPDFAEAHNDLGFTLVQAGRVAEAMGHYEQAVHLNPEYAEAHYNLGIGLLQLGRTEAAIGQFEQVLRIKPDDAETHGNLGIALVRLGRLPEAMGHWEQAVHFNPAYAEAHYNLGIALEQTGKVPEAIEHYEQALRSKPDFTEARDALARLRAVP